jgi:hypothetical protein
MLGFYFTEKCGLQSPMEGLGEFDEMACENAKRNDFRMNFQMSDSLSLNNFF